MTPEVYAIYGASGCGRGIMPLARAALNSEGISSNNIFFIDDGLDAFSINGQRILKYEDFLAIPAMKKHVAIAIANSGVREKIACRLVRDNIVPWEVKANNVVVMDEVDIGVGSILSPFVTLTSNIKIGKFFHANLYSYVEHDCIIGDFVTFAPGVKCNGNIVIEDHAYIGAGAIIKQGLPGNPIVIGRGAVIGMGTVVTKSVPAGVTVVGNPARQFIKNVH
jgi:sugar O-acyltransferase (sialic acid O-acetyltransferase NeuD family)